MRSIPRAPQMRAPGWRRRYQYFQARSLQQPVHLDDWVQAVLIEESKAEALEEVGSSSKADRSFNETAGKCCEEPRQSRRSRRCRATASRLWPDPIGYREGHWRHDTIGSKLGSYVRYPPTQR